MKFILEMNCQTKACEYESIWQNCAEQHSKKKPNLHPISNIFSQLLSTAGICATFLQPPTQIGTDFLT